MPPLVADASSKLRDALKDAGRGLVEREALVELVALAAVAGEHLLVIGPPGTAKSEAVRRVARALGGEVFEYLLGRFTEPSELFGPIDLRKLKEGVVETQTSGMLPEAEIALLGRGEALAAPLAILVDPPALVGVGAAWPIERAALAAWIERDAAADRRPRRSLSRRRSRGGAR